MWGVNVKNAKLFLIATSIIAVMAFAIWYEFSYEMRNQPESSPVTFPKIDRQPPAFDFNRGGMTALPTYDPNSTDPWQMDLDLFSYDLSTLDLSHSMSDLLYATFDLSENKIRVISISVGWGEDVTGYDELEAAVGEAKNASMLIVCSSIARIYGLKFQGLGRSSLADPNAFESYEPGISWARNFYAGEVRPSDRLLVPMDSYTASPTGVSEYVFYREGGWSLSIPYIAGLYALAAHIDPEITPERFWSLALETGRTIKLNHFMPNSIPVDEAIRLCREHRDKHKVRMFSQCWGCVRFSKEEPSKMCFHDPPENRGCKFINKLYDEPHSQNLGFSGHLG